MIQAHPLRAVSDPGQDDDAILHLQLHPTLQAWRTAGVSVLPRSRKARALLVLVALSEGRSISRPRAAALLWSSLERTDGLARLRNTLHHLQQDLGAAGLAPLRIDNGAISLKAGVALVQSDILPPQATSPSDAVHEFLAELDGIDPAFDRWLTHVRNKRRQSRVTPAPADDPVERSSLQGWLGFRPSLAVTEFDAADPGIDEYLAKAITEEVGSALAKFRWFTTITRSRQGQRLVAGDEGLPSFADYLLVGVLQRDDEQFRLSLKLLDLSNSGGIVWVAEFDASAGAYLQDRTKLAIGVAARLDTELMLIEAERRRRRPIHHQAADVYTLVFQAILEIYRLEREPFLGAGHALEEAIVLDRDSAFAHSWLAYWHMFLIGQGWATNPFQSMAQAGRAADRAMMLDPKDARAVTIAGHVKAFLSRRLDQAATLHELALQINPALPLAWHLYGVTHAYAGRLDAAYSSVARCRELAPNDPHGFFAEGALGIIHLLQGEHEAAVAIGRRVTERHPQFTSAYRSYLSALGHLGRKAEAANVLERLSILEPRFNLQRFRATAQYQRTQDLEHFLAGLRLAGLT